MENQVEVLETSDVSNEEIDRMLVDFETQGLSGEQIVSVAPASDPTDVITVTPSEQSRTTLEEFNALLEEVQQQGVVLAAIDPQALTQPYESATAEVLEILGEEALRGSDAPKPIEPIIPTNSPTLLVEESSSRFSSAVWYDAVRTKSVVLAGVGGIGSYVAFLLSRMKPASITIYDPDIVEEVNMSGQLYSKKDVGKTKVDCIAEMMVDYSNFFNTLSIADRYTIGSPAENIMICGFDNMQARRQFYNSWIQHIGMLPAEERKKCLFIDGRLAAEEFQVFCITGDDNYHQAVYNRDYLFSDAEADETICSYKQTSHCANMIGSIMVNLFVNFVANECDPLIPRDLPFITTYDAERMYFKTSI